MSDGAQVETERTAPEYLIVGQVVAPFGVKGEVKANILTEFPDRFSRLEQIVVAPFEAVEPARVPSGSLTPLRERTGPAAQPSTFRAPAQPTPFVLESQRLHKGQLILKLEGVDDADAAEALRAFWLFVPRESARRLPPGTYYLYQLVGADVYTADGAYIGRVSEVLTHTANDVYIVQGEGVTDPTGELLVPAIKSIVQSIDMDKGRITIAPLEEWS